MGGVRRALPPLHSVILGGPLSAVLLVQDVFGHHGRRGGAFRRLRPRRAIAARALSRHPSSPAAQAATAGLIRPWKAVYDASSQDFYFWHELSGEVSWVKPTNSLVRARARDRGALAAAAAAHAAARSHRAAALSSRAPQTMRLPDGWTAVLDEETVRTRPPPAPGAPRSGVPLVNASCCPAPRRVRARARAARAFFLSVSRSTRTFTGTSSWT